MTEEKLSLALQKGGKRPRLRLSGAIFLGVLVLLVLFRQWIAEGIGHAVCAQQKLNCVLKISRLDLGGLTFKDVQVRNPSAPNAAFSGRKLKIDFSWGSLFSPRASFIGGDELTVRLDLSGARPILGDLDETVKRFSGKGGDAGPIPHIDLKDVRIIGDTLLGPVEARGRVVMRGPEDFSIEFNAPTAKLSFPGAEMDLRTAELHAKSAGGNINAQLKLDLERFKAGSSVLSDVKIDVSLDQAAGVLTGKGLASAQQIALPDTRVIHAEAKADLESAAVDLEAFSLERWLPGVRKLNLNATSGEGLVAGVSWKEAKANADLAPRDGGGSGGKATFLAQGIGLRQGSAERLDIDLDLAAGAGVAGQEALVARGTAKLRGASLTKEQRARIGEMLSKPLEASLPDFAKAAAGAWERAGQKFEATLPVDFTTKADGFSVSAMNGAEIRAASGLLLAIGEAPSGKVVTWTSGKTTDWTAAGGLQLAGGGGPTIILSIASAEGRGSKLSANGSFDMKSWRVGDGVLAAQGKGLKFETGEGGGAASGEMAAQLTGGFAGGVWNGARASGAVAAVWQKDQFAAEAPQGLTVGWDEARYGDTKFGASRLFYKPSGRLVENVGDALLGSGTLAGFEIPVTGSNFTAKVKAGPTAFTWATAGQLKISFDMDPAIVDMALEDRTIPVRLNDITGLVELSEGWRVSGAFAGGTVKAAEAEVADLKGGYDLSGKGDVLNGKLNNLSLRVFDPLPQDQRRFEAATFEGAANLKHGVADFTGLFAMQRSGVQIASVSGKHSLKTGSGDLTFAPTPLIFRPGSFEPKALSPLLVGPANVVGRVDIAGGAAWSPDGLKANAALDLRQIGFALSGAGVFEGVSGKVVIDDLLTLKSAPGQTITLDKVTLGLPIEKGVIKFQLIGFEAIRLESAAWPFVGGEIRIRPIDFEFGAEQNRLIAQAVNWDLAALVKQFDIKDIKVDGIVSGDFPVVFTTGSAEIDNAQLEASSKGGVIQYTGSTGDAAASTDGNAKMLFDALKDFRYQVMKLGLDGDLAGRMTLTMSLLGRNPAVLNGKAFALNISVDSPLVDLVTSFNRQLGDFAGLGVKPDIEVSAPTVPNETRN